LLKDDVLAGGLQLRRLILGQRVAAPHGTYAPPRENGVRASYSNWFPFRFAFIRQVTNAEKLNYIITRKNPSCRFCSLCIYLLEIIHTRLFAFRVRHKN
jgi:hypothetical protein